MKLLSPKAGDHFEQVLSHEDSLKPPDQFRRPRFADKHGKHYKDRHSWCAENSFNNGKAAWADNIPAEAIKQHNIPAEAIKAGGDISVDTLHDFDLESGRTGQQVKLNCQNSES